MTSAPSSPAPAPPRPGVTVVVLGAGAGNRVGAGVNKVLIELAGRPLLAWSLTHALATTGVDRVVVVAAPTEHAEVADALSAYLPQDGPSDGPEVALVPGGTSRHGSEWAALQAVAGHVEAGRTDVVAIHDGARPLASPALFDAVVAAARRHGGALPAAATHGLVTADLTPAPRWLVGVQTPQAFRARPLLEAYRAAARDGFEGTDTAATFERYAGLPVVAVPSTPANLKVTWPEDLALAEELLSAR
ncbi:2-C-methyl-D-erythritol 4-phosphate cytidylyltransferase [Nocardioides sp. REDSEA-S30_B4]|uniref:IspD/TarI family cytidylyltransferase n=1 Tax=Nocardioides sp. REDSEA-S30_B4 TaxID=1811552 RepID=UPI0025DC93DD|nr:2-C-methyl-D-erythritol 4-phosphate cytidylyltransferase [Nocardioides sp. REDSEA-S30_B4]